MLINDTEGVRYGLNTFCPKLQWPPRSAKGCARVGTEPKPCIRFLVLFALKNIKARTLWSSPNTTRRNIPNPHLLVIPNAACIEYMRHIKFLIVS